MHPSTAHIGRIMLCFSDAAARGAAAEGEKLDAVCAQPRGQRVAVIRSASNALTHSLTCRRMGVRAHARARMRSSPRRPAPVCAQACLRSMVHSSMRASAIVVQLCDTQPRAQAHRARYQPRQRRGRARAHPHLVRPAHRRAATRQVSARPPRRPSAGVSRAALHGLVLRLGRRCPLLLRSLRCASSDAFRPPAPTAEVGTGLSGNRPKWERA